MMLCHSSAGCLAKVMHDSFEKFVPPPQGGRLGNYQDVSFSKIYFHDSAPESVIHTTIASAMITDPVTCRLIRAITSD